MATPGVTDTLAQSPEPQYSQMIAAQNQIIADQPNTLAGGPTKQYGPDDYVFESGVGTIRYSAQTASLINTQNAVVLAGAFNNQFPLPSNIKPDVDQYYFVGLLTDPVNSLTPVNAATMKYFERMFELMTANQFEHIISVAYEILDFFCPVSWKQLNYLGLPAQSGWTPPSSFLQPTNTEPMTYLARVHTQLLNLAKSKGQPAKFQIGEPWWWDGSYNTGQGKNAPCIYDALTMQMYKTETGNDVPTPKITSIFNPVASNQWPYIDWLCVKLGNSTNFIRDTVKNAVSGAEATLLFFTPQIMSPSSELTSRLNFPITEWKYPNYDFVQIEDYDWIIAGDTQRVPETFKAATEVLAYPLNVVHYFIGFNLLPETAKIVWGNCDVAFGMAMEANIPFIYPWSYTQVVRDGVVIRRKHLINDFGAGDDVPVS